MSKIDLSIWGIRSGFESAGIYHTHSDSNIKQLQQNDGLFRGISELTKANSGGFYCIEYTSLNKVISYVFTEIKEYKPSGDRRDAYVVFSLIIPRGMTFAQSPVAWFRDFAIWYKKQQNNHEIDYNNFTDGQIQEKIADLPELVKEACSPSGNNRYVEGVTNLNSLFESKSYLQHKQLFLFTCPCALDSVDRSFVKIDIKQEQQIEADKSEQERINKEQEVKKQEIIKQKSKELHELIQLKKYEQVSLEYSKFEHRNELDSVIKETVHKFEKLQKDKIVAEKLSSFFKRYNGQPPTSQDKNPCHGLDELEQIVDCKQEISRENWEIVLDPQVLQFINICENQLYRKQKECRKYKKDLEQRKRNKQKMFIAIPLFVTIALIVSSIIFEVPKSFYNTDNSKTSKGSGQNDTTSYVKKITQPLSWKEKFLFKGELVFTDSLKQDSAFWKKIGLNNEYIQVVKEPNREEKWKSKIPIKYDGIYISKKLLHRKAVCDTCSMTVALFDDSSKYAISKETYDSINNLLGLTGKDRFLSFEEDKNRADSLTKVKKQEEARSKEEQERKLKNTNKETTNGNTGSDSKGGSNTNPTKELVANDKDEKELKILLGVCGADGVSGSSDKSALKKYIKKWELIKDKYNPNTALYEYYKKQYERAKEQLNN